MNTGANAETTWKSTIQIGKKKFLIIWLKLLKQLDFSGSVMATLIAMIMETRRGAIFAEGCRTSFIAN